MDADGGSWMDRRDDGPPHPSFQRPVRSGETRRGDPLEQRLDRWVNAGRQFVDGVSGSRPGLRSPRNGDRAERSTSLREGLNGLGRWMEHQLDQFLEDEEDWREPWQEERPTPPPSDASRSRPRRPLEAISRRGARSTPASAVSSSPPGENPPPQSRQDEEWPGEETFTLPRWRRPDSSARQPASTEGDRGTGTAAQPPMRPLPRSSRRRQSSGTGPELR